MLEFVLDGISVLAALIVALCWFTASRVHVPAPAETEGKGALLGGWLIGCLRCKRVDLVATAEAQAKWNTSAAGAAMRALTRLGIVVESISKFARELERYRPGLHEQISKEEIRRYVDREGNGAFANTAPSVSKRRLGEAGQDLLALVLQFRDTAAAKLSSFAILERVLRDQFEIVDDECGDRDAKRAAIRDPKDVPCDTVGNPADPDASYNAHKGQGYMAQIVETYCEDDSNEAVAATPDLITHVEVHKMKVHPELPVGREAGAGEVGRGDDRPGRAKYVELGVKAANAADGAAASSSSRRASISLTPSANCARLKRVMTWRASGRGVRIRARARALINGHTIRSSVGSRRRPSMNSESQPLSTRRNVIAISFPRCGFQVAHARQPSARFRSLK